MGYGEDPAQRQLLTAIGTATDGLGRAVADLGVAFDLLDDATAERVEDELFRPVQRAYGRAKRAHAAFAERHGLVATLPAAASPSAPSHGVKALIEGAVASAEGAAAQLGGLQDSMVLSDALDGTLQADLAEVRILLAPLRGRSKTLISSLGR